MPVSFRFFGTAGTAGTAGTVNLPMLSADADNDLRWLVGFRRRPPATFIVHDKPVESAALQPRIAIEPGWASHMPQPIERVAPT